ncbi:interleukin-17C-like [Sebastes fasciatus]|uniref:interleukin-17C-like n=1 Tax=Sebastes fasciatus TaxID=394691 RepID=UPI003D9E8788
MSRLVSLQMISLLIFTDHLLSAAAGSSSGCVSGQLVNISLNRFQRSYSDKQRFFKVLQDTRTNRELNNRSLSPWNYTFDREVDRSPYEIPFAKCLHLGCIINQREVMDYNSVPVFASLMVMRKTPCKRDPNKYKAKKDVINVPVACTCVVPKYA